MLNKDGSEPKVYTYEGDIYIRPISRGIVLEGLGIDGEYIEEWIEKLAGGDGHYKAVISVEIQPDD